MPQIFKVGGYWVYFWSNEGRPIEPVHVHISHGAPRENATKVWITKRGRCVLAVHQPDVPLHTLRNIMRIIEARSDEVVLNWEEYFGEVRYFC